jgi:hypothetical protein
MMHHGDFPSLKWMRQALPGQLPEASLSVGSGVPLT